MIGAARASSRNVLVFGALTALAVSFSTSTTSVDGWMIVAAPSNRRKGVPGRLFATHEKEQQKPSSSSLLLVSTTVQQQDQSGDEKEEEYQESPSELRVLEFWDQKPFDTVQRMVRGMVTQNTADMPRFRVAVKDNEEHNGNCSDSDDEKFETEDDVFTKFYQGRSCRIEESTDGARLIGLASQSRWQQQRKNRYNSFRLDVCYVGPSFCGWQRQPNESNNPQVHQVPHLPSVQQEIEDKLAAALPQPKVNVRVSGRTDAGVHAVDQVARVRVRDHSLSVTDIMLALQDVQTGGAASVDNGRSWRCWRVVSVSDKFHPTFGTQSRSYVYLMDAQAVANAFATANVTTDSDLIKNNGNPSSTSVALVKRLNDLLQPLQGRALDYVGMSYGKVKTETTVCILHHARAVHLVETTTSRRLHDNSDDNSSSSRCSTAIAIELTGDRFLRRMVRILVATAMVMAADDDASVSSGNSNDDNSGRLMQLVQAQDRRLTAKAAPPMGLVFVGAHMPVDDEDDDTV